MRLRFLLPGVLLAAGVAAVLTPAAADPPPWAGHGGRHGREWRQDRWEREQWGRHEARRHRRGGYDAPVPAYAPPPGYPGYPPPPPHYAPPPLPAPGIGVFIPFR